MNLIHKIKDSKRVEFFISFTDFPIEIQILILSCCLDDELLQFSKCNDFYFNLIQGRSFKNLNDNYLFQWHELLWRIKLLQLYKLNNELKDITKNYKYHYFILNNLSFNIPDEFRKQLQNIVASHKIWSFSNDKKSVENIRIGTWLSVRSNFQMSKKYFKLRGFEILIDKYNKNSGNSWILVIGVGLKSNTEYYAPLDKTEYMNSGNKDNDYVFNLDRSITEFVKSNKGVGLLSTFIGMKAFGRYCSFEEEQKNKTVIREGSKVSCLINFELKQIYFFVNNVHKVTVYDPFIDDEDIYYPIISLSPGVGVTINPFPKDSISLRNKVIHMKLGELIK
ncbi:hypothetical protein ABK040_008750 [Willaertia magna]